MLVRRCHNQIMIKVMYEEVFKGTYIKTFDSIAIVSPKDGNISFYLNSSSNYNSPFSMKQFVFLTQKHYTIH